MNISSTDPILIQEAANTSSFDKSPSLNKASKRGTGEMDFNDHLKVILAEVTNPTLDVDSGGGDIVGKIMQMAGIQHDAEQLGLQKKMLETQKLMFDEVKQMRRESSESRNIGNKHAQKISDRMGTIESNLNSMSDQLISGLADVGKAGLAGLCPNPLLNVTSNLLS